MDCKACKARWRADKIVDEHILSGNKEPQGYAGDKTDAKILERYIIDEGIVCPDC